MHFSVPDEGPLTDYESWMPDFMSGLAKGIEQSRAMVTKAVEADRSGETEVGTTQRDVVRQGVVNISVCFSVTAKWLKALTAYSKQDKLPVDCFDTETADMKNTESEYQDLTFEKLKIYYGAKGISLNPTQYKNNLGLYTPDGKYNIMAQLLSDNSHIPVRVAIFSGTKRSGHEDIMWKQLVISLMKLCKNI